VVHAFDHGRKGTAQIRHLNGDVAPGLQEVRQQQRHHGLANLVLNGQRTASQIVVRGRIGQGTTVGHATGVHKKMRSQRVGRFKHGSDACGGGFAAKGVHRQNRSQQPQLQSSPAQFCHGRVHVGQGQCGQSAKTFRVRPAQLAASIIESTHQRRCLVKRQTVDAKQTGQ
jgi:hypothetical protein